jgi:hypothetical protein
MSKGSRGVDVLTTKRVSEVNNNNVLNCHVPSFKLGGIYSFGQIWFFRFNKTIGAVEWSVPQRRRYVESFATMWLSIGATYYITGASTYGGANCARITPNQYFTPSKVVDFHGGNSEKIWNLQLFKNIVIFSGGNLEMVGVVPGRDPQQK